MNSSIKNVHFAKWLNRSIGSKELFHNRFVTWKKRDIYRWTTGANFPKAPALSKLLYDLHLHTGLEYTELVVECMSILQKDFKEYKYEQEKTRRASHKKTETD